MQILLPENNFDFSKEEILHSFSLILKEHRERMSKNLLCVLNILLDLENNSKIFSDVGELYDYVDNTYGSISVQFLYRICDNVVYLSVRLDSVETGKVSMHFSVINSVFTIELKR